MTQLTIKTEAEHREALAEIERLAESDPLPGTADGDHLAWLAVQVEGYEKPRFALS